MPTRGWWGGQAGAYWPPYGRGPAIRREREWGRHTEPHSQGGVTVPAQTAAEPAQSNALLEATVDALSGALGLRDPATGAHCGRVAHLASALGSRLRLSHQPL